MVDSRFMFADVGTNAKARKQLVSGTEIRYYKPRGDPDKIAAGQELDFHIASGPFFISNLNHLEVRMSIKVRKKAVGTGAPGNWSTYTQDDETKVQLVENLGSRLFEDIVFRNGEDEQKTNYTFTARGGRCLWEAFVLAHSDQTVRNAYNFTKYDPGNTVRMRKQDWFNDSEYAAFYKAHTDRRGAKFHVCPMAFPFETENRSLQKDQIYPNVSNNSVLGVTINRNFESLYVSSTHEVEFTIMSVKLAIATPRLTAEGKSAANRRNQSPVRYRGNKVVQDIYFTGSNDKNIRLKINRKRLPNYIIIQLLEDAYFNNDYTATSAKDHVAEPLKSNVKGIELLYNGLEMYQYTSPLDFEDKFARVMRQNILRNNPELLGVSKTAPDWINSVQDDEKTYTQEHMLLYFESNERNHETLIPLDGLAEDSKGNKDNTLDITLEAKGGANYLPSNARIVLTSVEIGRGLVYNMRDGTLDS